MPPKAKPRIRRPAARVRAPMRRPAREGERAEEPGRRRKVLQDLSMAELSKLGHIWVKKGIYYHQEIDLMGKVEGVRAQEGNVFLDLEAMGTRDEKLLKAITGKQGRRVSLHICAPDCNNQLTDEFLIHARDYEEADPRSQEWFTNLVEVPPMGEADRDDFEAMRAEAEKRKEEQDGRRDKSPKGKKDKKKKDKKDGGKKIKSLEGSLNKQRVKY